MTLGIANSPAASERLGRLGALPPERPAPGRAQPRSGPSIRLASGDLVAQSRLGSATRFLIHELLAAAPELGALPPSRLRTVAAYQAQLAQRIRYSGPVSPVDLRV